MPLGSRCRPNLRMPSQKRVGMRMRKTLTNSSPSTPLTNALPVRKSSRTQMRREKVVARTLLTSKMPKELKQSMRKRKFLKRKKKSQKRRKPRRRSQKPKGSKKKSSWPEQGLQPHLLPKFLFHLLLLLFLCLFSSGFSSSLFKTGSQYVLRLA